MTETWRDVVRAPGYQVSDFGRVRRMIGYRCSAMRILKPRATKDGYLCAHLSIGGRKFNGPVHQLVCEAFCGARPSDTHQVAHADGVRTNNRAANLRWATPSENAQDRTAHGSHCGERNPRATLTDNQAAEIRRSLLPATKLAREFGVSRNQIWRIRTGRSHNDVTDLRREAEAA